MSKTLRVRYAAAVAPDAELEVDRAGDVDGGLAEEDDAAPVPRLEHVEEDHRAVFRAFDDLDFAGGVGGEEPAPADLGAIAQEAADSAAQEGVDIAVSAGEDLVLPVRALALKRCLINLVSNAASHASRVEVATRRMNGAVVIDVDDDGPGIPEELREEAFRPFNRLDEARNRNTEGVGLGLAIARDVARGHGGEVELSESHLGGLKARVRLPA